MRRIWKTADLFAMGGGTYALLEVLWRGYTHWTMAVLGGALFLSLGLLDTHMPAALPLPLRCCLGGGLITASELAAGCVLNLGLGLSIWDYSALPFQLLGQICLPYSLLWVLLSALAMPLYSAMCRYGWQDAKKGADRPLS